MNVFNKISLLYSKFRFYVNVILTALFFLLGWLFTAAFYNTELAKWLTNNANNPFVGDFLNPLPVIVEMLFKSFVPMFLALGVSFLIYNFFKETGVNKVGWALSLFAKGSIKTIQFFTSILIGGCGYIIFHWSSVHKVHPIFEYEDGSEFKWIISLLFLFWLVCGFMKFAATIRFKALRGNASRIEISLKQWSDKNAIKIAYFCLGIALLGAVLFPFYELYGKVMLLKEACVEDTKMQCDLPDISALL